MKINMLMYDSFLYFYVYHYKNYQKINYNFLIIKE